MSRCLNCKAMFVGIKGQKFCSHQCNVSHKIEKICKECGDVYKGVLASSYCSRSCRDARLRRTSKIRHSFTCRACGTRFFKRRRTNAKGAPYKYCSIKCANNSEIKGLIKERTRHKTTGYISIRCPDHPRAYGGRVREHVLVMESVLGRHLTKFEVVHHKNYIEDDNRKENLYLCRNRSHHDQVHSNTRYLIKEFIRLKNLQNELQEFMDNNYFCKLAIQRNKT
jgi:hypothetical protein